MQPIQANGYQIFFNADAYLALNHRLKEKPVSSIFLLTDSNTNQLCASEFLSKLETDARIEVIEMEPGEETKNIESCANLWSTLSELGADRKSLVINLGGGVITDMGGFVASTYKRGISFIHVPTTLLGMVDAAIGGKNGVDLGSLKNQVGVINPPELLLIDTSFLRTLPPRQMRSGLAEMLKHGLIADKSYWEAFSRMKEMDAEMLDILVYRSVQIKNEVVLQDPTENGIRKILNFGHTLGHAIESYFLESEAKPVLLHGEAIAAGMVMEAHLGWQMGILETDAYREIKAVILEMYGRIEMTASELPEVVNLLQHDKKNEFGKILFVLLSGIGSPKIDCIVSNEMILKAFQDYVA